MQLNTITMHNLTSTFSRIEAELIQIEKSKKAVIFSALFGKIYYLIFGLAVLSLIIGFLHAFPFSEFEMRTAVNIFKAVFYLILIIAVYSFSGEQLKQWQLFHRPEKPPDKQTFLIRRIILTALIIVVAYISGTYYIGDELMSKSFIFKAGSIILSLLIFMIPVLLLKKTVEKFATKYKQLVIPEIIENQSIKYLPDQMIPEQDFRNSKIFSIHQIHRYKGSDLIEGQTEQIHFRLSYLHVLDKKVEKSKSKTEVSISELFKGVLFKSDFNKNFNGHTLVIPDYSRSVFGSVFGEMLNELIGRMWKNLVKLEDPVFESNFSVFSDNQIEARYILTPSMIERINGLKEAIPFPFKISFTGNAMFIAIFSHTNILNPDIFSRLDRYESFEKYASRIHLLLNIVKELKLNIDIYKT